MEVGMSILDKEEYGLFLVFGNLKYKAENNKWFYPAIKAGLDTVLIHQTY